MCVRIIFFEKYTLWLYLLCPYVATISLFNVNRFRVTDGLEFFFHFNDTVHLLSVINKDPTSFTICSPGLINRDVYCKI